MVDLNELITKLQGQIRNWDTQLEDMKAKADEASGKLKAEYDKKVADLSEKKDTLSKEIDRLAEAGKSAGQDVVSGLQKAADEVKNAFQSAISKFAREEKMDEAEPEDEDLSEPPTDE